MNKLRLRSTVGLPPRRIEEESIHTYRQWSLPAVFTSVTLASICLAFSPQGFGALPTSGLELQLMGDAGVITSGSAVTTWQDQATSDGADNATQTAAAMQPTRILAAINGKPAVNFVSGTVAANSDIMTTAQPLSGAFTILAVARLDAMPVGGGAQLLGTRKLTNGAAGQFQFHVDGNRRFIFRSGLASTDTVSSTAVTFGQNFVVAAYGSGGSVSVSLNGGAPVTTAGHDTNFDATGITIGGPVNSSAIRTWNGNIVEVLIYNRVLTAAELGAAGQYLEQKYALNTAYGDPVITTNQPMNLDFPAQNAADGDVTTWAMPTGTTYTPVEYTITYPVAVTVNRVKFWQHPYSFANGYKILGDANGDGVFELTLVNATAVDRNIPTGNWVQTTFGTVTVKAIKFQPTSGYMRDVGYPGLAEISAYNSASPIPADPGTASGSVQIGQTWSVNGVPTLRKSVFGLPNLGDQTVIDNYIKPLDLGFVEFWLGICENVPADPQNPTTFDRAAFNPGGWADNQYNLNKARFDAARDMGAYVDFNAVCAPPYMRVTNIPNRTYTGETIFDPPADPADWGEMVGRLIKRFNELSGNLIQESRIWNEPQTARYLPVAWSEKASTYVNIFRLAAPEMIALNPGLRVNGPVFSGGGILQYSKPADVLTSTWNPWLVPLEALGNSFQTLDAHMYNTSASVLRAEANVWANYSTLQRGSVVPVNASEANIAFSTPAGVDNITRRWTVQTSKWVDFLVQALEQPDTISGIAYFYIWDSTDSSKIIQGMFTAPGHLPNPIYWGYWAMRNLRGDRLYSTMTDPGINLVGARNGTKMNVFIQNKEGYQRNASISLPLPSGVSLTSPTLEYVEYNTATGLVEHGTRAVSYSGGILTVAMKPYGLYSFLATTSGAYTPQIVADEDYFGDKVWQKLAIGAPVSFNVSLPADFSGASSRLLRFGTMGCPYGRYSDENQIRVPLIVTVNGTSHSVKAGTDNEIVLNASEVLQNNTITFAYDGVPPVSDFYIMSTSLQLGGSAADLTTSGLQLHLKGDAGVITSGGAVTTWQDQATGDGSDHATQTDAARRPTLKPSSINAKPAVYFSPGAAITDCDYMGTSQPMPSAFTIIAVARLDAVPAGGSSELLGTKAVTNGVSGRFQFFIDSNRKFVFRTAGSATVDTVTSAAITLGQPFIVAGYGTAGSVSVAINGGAATTATGHNTAFDSMGITVGGPVVAIRSWNGDIAEVLIYDRVLTPAEISQTYSALADKYGL